MNLNLRYATVIDKNDPDKKGRVQVRILPELKDVKENFLPWADPFIVGSDSGNFASHLPEDGSVVKVLVDKDFKYFYYIGGAYIEEVFDYGSIESSLGGVEELSSTNYPEINFQKLSDGSIFFHNALSGDLGILQSTGSYVVINDSGEMYINVGGTKLSIIDGEVSFATDLVKLTGDSDSAVLFSQLNTALSNFVTTLTSHTHTDPVSGATGPPNTPIQLDISLAESQNVKLGG